MKKTIGRRGMLFSFFNFGSSYNRVLCHLGFSVYSLLFVIFVLSSKLLTNSLNSWVADAVPLVLRYL